MSSEVPLAIPARLAKDDVMSELANTPSGDAGLWRYAIRLVVKNVWDYEEMIRRGIKPSAEQLLRATDELERISEAI